MRIGLHIGNFDWEGGSSAIPGTLSRIARAAEEAEFDSIWVMDHLFQLGPQYGKVHGPVDGAMLEAYSTLAFLSGVTERIRLGPLVTCAFFRPPGLLAKEATTLDVLSGGRTYLGVGAGWYEREAIGLGIPFPVALRERFDRLEETLQIVRHMWSGEQAPFRGRYFTLEEPINSPPPVSTPHPPILIGGTGERRTLRLVAEYGDAWNAVIGSPVDSEDFGVLRAGCNRGSLGWLRNKMRVLEGHCANVGRPFEEIEKTVTTYIRVGPGGMTEDDIVALCGTFREIGFSHVILNVLGIEEITPITLMGEGVVAAVHTL